MNFFYVCSECGRTFDFKPGIMLCDSCSGKQKVDEPLRGILDVGLEGKPIRGLDVHELLPVEKEFFPSIPVGKSKMWKPDAYPGLFIKDDSGNPSSSFKDRASYLVAAFARKHKINEIIVASTGNAASSMSCIGAAANLSVTIFIPKTAPKAKMVQSLQYGARVILVNGTYDMAYDLSMEYSKIKTGLNRNTAYNPLTIEGKKTVSLEIVSDLCKAPDRVFVPTGDGVIIAGVYKGFHDLLKLGMIDNMPTIICVQADGSNAIARAFKNGVFDKQSSSTVADSISVDVPRNGYHALSYLKKFGGDCICVSDDAILKAQHTLASKTGLFTEPAGAAAFAGYLAYRDKHEMPGTSVVLTTGNGLKDIDSAMKQLTIPTKAITHIKEIL